MQKYIFIHKLKKWLLAGLNETPEQLFRESTMFQRFSLFFNQTIFVWYFRCGSNEGEKIQLEIFTEIPRKSFDPRHFHVMLKICCQILERADNKVIESVKVQHMVENKSHQRVNNRHEDVVDNFPLTINFDSQWNVVFALLCYEFPQSITEFYWKLKMEKLKWIFRYSSFHEFFIKVLPM